MNKALTGTRSISIGLLAQILTLGGMILPILLGLGQEIVSLVFVSGAATLIVHPATLGTYSVYAALRHPRRAVTAMSASLWCLLTTVILVGAMGALLLLCGSSHWGILAMLVSLNVLGQGLYFLVLSHMTMLGSVISLMQARLTYALANSLAMLVASTVFVNDYSLAFAAAIGYLFSTGVSLVWVGRSIPWRRLVRVPFDELTQYARQSRPVVASFLLAGLSGQSSSLSLVLLGPVALPWAIATRISNGFQTLTMQVIAPHYDIRLSRAMRAGDLITVRAFYRRGVVVGSILGVLGSVTAAVFVLLNGALNGFSGNERNVIVGAIAFYWGAQIASSVNAKYLTYAKQAAVRFRWEVARCVAVFSPMFFLTGVHLLILLSAAMGLSMFWFMWLGWKHVRAKTPGRRRRTLDRS